MKKSQLTLLAIVFSTVTFAQSFEAVLAGSTADASKYFKDYFNPVFKGLTYNMGQGWYTSARTHKKMGFDITVSLSASRPPVSEEMFAFNPADYNYMTVKTGSNILPTAVGTTTSTIMQVDLPYDSDNNGTNDEILHAEFNAPNGVKQDIIDAGVPFTAIPSPMAQIGFGLGNTDVSLRYMPNVGKDGVNVKLFGLAVKHNLLQHFKKGEDKGSKGLFSLSGLIGYTKLSGSFEPQTSTVPGANQSTSLTITNFNIEAIAGINFKIIEFYGGLGYTTGKTNFAVKGSYDFNYTDSTNATITKTVTDPFDIDFNASSVKTTVGARLNLAFFKIFASYTLQKYSSYNAGIAISIR
jgi:hypothetical protein